MNKEMAKKKAKAKQEGTEEEMALKAQKLSIMDFYNKEKQNDAFGRVARKKRSIENKILRNITTLAKKRAQRIKCFDVTNIYSSAMQFLGYCLGIMENATRDNKECYMYPLIKKMESFILFAKRGYAEHDLGKKLGYMQEMNIYLCDIDTMLMIMRDCAVLPMKRITNLIWCIGDLHRQTNFWMDSVHKNCDSEVQAEKEERLNNPLEDNVVS